jgi:hypothetical protein
MSAVPTTQRGTIFVFSGTPQPGLFQLSPRSTRPFFKSNHELYLCPTQFSLNSVFLIPFSLNSDIAQLSTCNPLPNYTQLSDTLMLKRQGGGSEREWSFEWCAFPSPILCELCAAVGTFQNHTCWAGSCVGNWSLCCWVLRCGCSLSYNL